MKVELHLHTSRYSGCAIISPPQIMQKLMDVRYDAVFLTEHDAVWTDWELDKLRKRFPGLAIFPGVEKSLTVGGLGHLLVLGTNDPTYLAMQRGAEIIQKARSEGHLTILAHPFRWEGAADLLAGDILPDAIEHYTNNHYGPETALAAAAAKKLNLPLVNAGDTHALTGADRFWIETDRPIEQADDIRQIILENAYSNHSQM